MLRRLLGNFRWGVLPVPGRMLAVVFFIFLFIIPLITDSRATMHMMTLACVYAIFAVSWDLLSGYTGQVNFGHALFFGVGAYASALLYTNLGWPPAATIPLGALIAALVGAGTCFPALRLRGPYLSLLTLAFPLLLMEIIRSIPETSPLYAGGYVGITGLPRFGEAAVDRYYVCLIVMLVSVLIMWKLTDAGSKYVRTGLLFHAIREDEIAARASGINTIRYKILAFAIGGFFAGVAGGLYAHLLTVAGPGTLGITMSFQAIIWVIFGGIVSIYGAVVGVFALYPLVELLRGTVVHDYRFIIMSGMVILILLFMPEGIAVRIRHKIERQCPRCKLTNAALRSECRACGASLRYVPDSQET
ncbi:MAG: branched-chain amino acid ABC transporter permease [Dehalococcoidia bacterium]